MKFVQRGLAVVLGAGLGMAVLAQAPSYSLRYLGDFSLGMQSQARGVNNLDVVVGWGVDRNSFLDPIDRAFWWRVQDSATALQRLTGLDPDRGSRAYAINDGIVESIVGEAEDATGKWVAVKWSGRFGSPTPLLQSTGVSSVALAVSETGVAVGWEQFDVSADSIRAFVRRPSDSDRILLPPLTVNKPAPTSACTAGRAQAGGWRWTP